MLELDFLYIRTHQKNCLIGVNRMPVFGARGLLSFFYLNMFSVGLGIPVFAGEREMARFFVCLATVVLQEVGFGDQVDDVLSAPCLEGLGFLRMRMLRNVVFTVACAYPCRRGTHCERWQDC